MRVDATHPLDEVHQEMIYLRRKINQVASEIRDAIMKWEPRRCPDDFQ